jgi:hypothetical protein
MIVDIAFVVVPSILGLGAAGLIGSSAIRTAKDVMNSISVLQNLGPGIQTQLDIHKGRWKLGEKVRQYGEKYWQRDGGWNKVWGGFTWFLGASIAPDQLFVSGVKALRRKKNNQDTQGKQDEKGGGGDKNPPPPPDTKSDNNQDTQGKRDEKGGGSGGSPPPPPEKK